MVCSSFLKANAGLATEKARKGYRTDYKNCTATASLYMNTALPPQLFRMTRGKSAPWCQAAPQFAYLLSTSTSRLLNLLKIIELTRDRIGEGFSLMESLRHDIDHAKRRGRNSVIKLVLGSPDEGAKRRNPGEFSLPLNLRSPSLDSALRASLRLSKIAPGDFVASLHPDYILRGLFLGQYN